jgi:preprotein translocase subunit SecG
MLSNVLLLSDTGFKLYISFCYIFLVLTFIAALITVIIILFQKSNSDGIQGITASSETFFGKNKGRSIESKLKKWSWILLGVIAALSIVLYILQIMMQA